MNLRLASLLSAFALLTACGEGKEDAGPSVEERLAMPADPANGRAIFSQCAVCHNAGRDLGHRVGPNLYGVYGEEAGVHADFSYSRALRRSGVVWDLETLDAYLTEPQSVIPGGRMSYQGNANPADRRDIIAYLRTLSVDGEE